MQHTAIDDEGWACEVGALIGNDAASLADFMMYTFKISPCTRPGPHDWRVCPFAHPKEHAARRDPTRIQYTTQPCPAAAQGGDRCPRGDACTFAHNVFESWLHPSRYKTQFCRNGKACSRRICFFAHSAAELRVPAGSSAASISRSAPAGSPAAISGGGRAHAWLDAGGAPPSVPGLSQHALLHTGSGAALSSLGSGGSSDDSRRWLGAGSAAAQVPGSGLAAVMATAAAGHVGSPLVMNAGAGGSMPSSLQSCLQLPSPALKSGAGHAASMTGRLGGNLLLVDDQRAQQAHLLNSMQLLSSLEPHGPAPVPAPGLPLPPAAQQAAAMGLLQQRLVAAAQQPLALPRADGSAAPDAAGSSCSALTASSEIGPGVCCTDAANRSMALRPAFWPQPSPAAGGAQPGLLGQQQLAAAAAYWQMGGTDGALVAAPAGKALAGGSEDYSYMYANACVSAPQGAPPLLLQPGLHYTLPAERR